MTELKKYNILFVCLGNICRSPAAHGVMESILAERGMTDWVEVDSAGISSYHHPQQHTESRSICQSMRSTRLILRTTMAIRNSA